MNKILIVDDEIKILKILKLILIKEGYEVKTVKSGEESLLAVKNYIPSLIIMDLNLPGMNGVETMLKVKENINPQFVFITAHGDMKTAVKAIKLGAYNFLSKPFDNDEFLGIVKGALAANKLQNRVKSLEELLYTNNPLEKIIGEDEEINKIKKMIIRAAPTDATILINGESGSGKELFVEAVYQLSNRKNKAFIPINCAAIPENLFESELFGYKKGSFTGADKNYNGKFIEADTGTLFLDEIGEMPLNIQAKLLRVLESGEVTRLGESKPRTVDVRIIAATNKDLKNEVEKGKFREDLFYRLNVITFKIPPLRERKSDIILLAKYFLKKFTFDELKLSDTAMEFIQNYDWPGNVRELQNEIKRATILADKVIEPDLFSCYDKNKKDNKNILLSTGFDLEKYLKKIEQQYYLAAMRQTNNNKTKAAALLNISYRTFNYNWEKTEK